MIAQGRRHLSRVELVNVLRRERRERAENGHWKVFRLPAQPDHHNYLVRNVDSNSAYRLAWEPSVDLIACTCEDFKNTCRKFGILCKHLEVVRGHQSADGPRSPVRLEGTVVTRDGRHLVSLGPGNGRLVNHHPRLGCTCFMKTFCYRTGQKCFHGTMLDRWIEAGLVTADTPLDAPVVRLRVAALPSQRPWDEWRAYEGSLSVNWSVLPAGSKAYVVDNGGRDVPHQVVLDDLTGACSCAKFYQTGFCDHVDIVRDAVRRRVVVRSKSVRKPTRPRAKPKPHGR